MRVAPTKAEGRQLSSVAELEDAASISKEELMQVLGTNAMREQCETTCVA